MRILLAGASGVFGRVLIPALIAAGHEVVGITRTPTVSAPSRPCEPTRSSPTSWTAPLLAAIAGPRFEAVISQPTALKKLPTGNKDMDVTNALRTVGTENLMAAAKATGAARFLTQSMIFGYGYGDLVPARSPKKPSSAPRRAEPSPATAKRCCETSRSPSPSPGSTASRCATACSTAARRRNGYLDFPRRASCRSSRRAPTPSST